MKYNERELAILGESKGEMEGRLSYKKMNSSNYYNHSGLFKERWFKLKNNCLFYFRFNDGGKVDTKPAGVFILENASIQMEHGQDTPFSFSISFIDEPEKRHLYSGMSESSVVQWVLKLRCASYEYLRSQLYVLQSKIYSKTGKDPLLMVPRNEGSKKWLLGDPCGDDTAPFGGSFKSHLTSHNSSIHVVRSKSFVNVIENVKTKKEELPLENPWLGPSGLERSQTSTHVNHTRRNPFDADGEGTPSLLLQKTTQSKSKNNSIHPEYLTILHSSSQQHCSQLISDPEQSSLRNVNSSSDIFGLTAHRSTQRPNPFNSHSARNSPLLFYHKSAPSPPARKKNPLMMKIVPSTEISISSHNYSYEHSSQSSLETPPQPPPRKPSPKTVQLQNEIEYCTTKLENPTCNLENSTTGSNLENSENLIEF